MARLFKVLVLLFGLGLMLLLGYSFVYSATQGAEERCEKLRVSVKDSAHHRFMTPERVEQYLQLRLGVLEGLRLDSINTHRIEGIIAELPSVREVQAYTVGLGELRINVWQRTPLFRIIDGKQGACYVDAHGRTFPLDSQYAAHVLVVSGNLPAPPPDITHCDSTTSVRWRTFWPQLFELVQYLQQDRLWKNLFCQVYIVSPQRVELIPRVGGQIVVLGAIDGYQYKLNKLWSYFRTDLPQEVRDQYAQIDLSYSNQIVCQKKR
ncbi:MAG: hypothetical protein CSA97_00170 [Bacteroidetes bacterium]|nr:MAG: hypothetical protein CSA97_00170 [Bacteroidota bacterium]